MKNALVNISSIGIIIALLSFSYIHHPKNAAIKEIQFDHCNNSSINQNQLRAVLVVGPAQDVTDDNIASMNKIADFLRGKGVIVSRFYNEKSIWNKIVMAAKGANFFIYAGHGTTLGGDGKVGGLCLSNPEYIDSKAISEKLKLHTNAIVIFKSVCYGAGSSASDDGDIGIDSAINRVTNYGQPFFEAGAGCYYANNLGNGCLTFLSDFFDGKTVIECFRTSATTWCDIEKIISCNISNNFEIGIASQNHGGFFTRTTYSNGVKTVKKLPNFKTYDIAFIADSTFSKTKLFSH